MHWGLHVALGNRCIINSVIHEHRYKICIGDESDLHSLITILSMKIRERDTEILKLYINCT